MLDILELQLFLIPFSTIVNVGLLLDRKEQASALYIFLQILPLSDAHSSLV